MSLILLSYPVPVERRAGFGPGAAGRFRPGLDLFVPQGTPVHAAQAGQVVFAGPKGKAGNAVIIRHAPGIETGYFHNSRVLVSAGNIVRSGDVIAQAGATGTTSLRPRVHFVVSVGGKLVNPDEAVALGLESTARGLVHGGHAPGGSVNYATVRTNVLEYAVLIGLAIVAGAFD